MSGDDNIGRTSILKPAIKSASRSADIEIHKSYIALFFRKKSKFL